MPRDFVGVFIQLFYIAVILAIVYAGIDAFFTLSSDVTFTDIIQMNLIFSVSSGFIMLGLFLLILGNETWAMRVFSSEESIGIFILSLSAIIMYVLKSYLFSWYELKFSYEYLIIIPELVIYMVIPYRVTVVLKQFGKAFAH